MSQTAVFWPMLAHVLLVFIVYVILAIRRRDTVLSGAAQASAYKQRASEPESTMTVANNLMNQFEAPVLLHVWCLALHAIGAVSPLALMLAWLFVASRYVHAWIHLTTNRLKYRSAVIRVGVLLLALMWLLFAWRLTGS